MVVPGKKPLSIDIFKKCCCSSIGCNNFSIGAQCTYFFDFKFVSPIAIGTWLSNVDCFRALNAQLSTVLPSTDSGDDGDILQSVQCLNRTNTTSCECVSMDCLLTFQGNKYLYINSLTCNGSAINALNMSSSLQTDGNFDSSHTSENCTAGTTFYIHRTN